MRRTTAVTILLLATLTAFGSAAWAVLRQQSKAPTWVVARVRRGEIVSKIAATGTLEPEAAFGAREI